MPIFKNILTNLPEVESPADKKVEFKSRLKWTLLILVFFFILGLVPLYGLGQNALSNFEFLSIILGASFGSMISLGIGPIVTASIVLQLLTGSGILKLDTASHEGRVYFQGLQKFLAFFFIIFEAAIYVLMGGLAPALTLHPTLFVTAQILLIIQLIIGGILILYMDEVINKFGLGSGVSLFIVAGVASSVFVRAFSPLTTAGTWAFGSGQPPVGKLWVLFISLLGRNPTGALLALAAILATIFIFLISVYVQSMKVEIPLSFGRVRGHGIRWPLNFMYTSNIPVILVAALLANVQLLARLVQGSVQDNTSGIMLWISQNILGQYSGNIATSGLARLVTPPLIIENIITGSFQALDLLQALSYILFFVVGSIIFSIFWVQTAGLDAGSQANQILKSGLQIPGFRRDKRVLEQVLSRYIGPLTVMGAIAVGLLASGADVLGALTNGTGLLLSVMIIYRLYEDIAHKYLMEMNPMFRKVMGK